MPLNRTVWRWMLPLGGTVVIGAVAWRLGVGPFIDGIALVNGPAVLAAAVITLFTTMSCAWRWRLVSRELGVDLPLRTAITAYFRSQFLNSVLPGDRFPRTPGRWGVDLGPRHPGLGNRSSSRSARQRCPAYPVLPFWS